MRKPKPPAHLGKGASIAANLLVKGIPLVVVWVTVLYLVVFSLILSGAYHHAGIWIATIPSVVIGGVVYLSAIGRRAIAVEGRGDTPVTRYPSRFLAVILCLFTLAVPLYFLTSPYQECIRDYGGYMEAQSRFPSLAVTETTWQNFVKEDCRQKFDRW